MCNKVEKDPTFGQRLLDYISQVVEECMPEDPAPLDEDEDDTQLFQPYTHPDHPDFAQLMQGNLSNIVRYRQIHLRKHMATCFKYGSKKCRSRFPRKIISVTSINKNGIIYIKRDDRWVNNYHRWITQMTRGNHDVQFLFTKK